MAKDHTEYYLPDGFSTAGLIYRSIRYYFRSSIEAININMARFGDSYTAVFPGNRLVIVTRDAGFINHVLRENHTNYHKSEFTSDRAGRLFGNGLLFSNGDYWLRQRRLIQPGFHSRRLQGLYDIVAGTVDECLTTFPTGDNIDIYPLVHQVAFEIALRSLFDVELPPGMMVELSSLFHDLQKFFVMEVKRPLRKLTYPLTGAEKLSKRRSENLRGLIRDIVRRRRIDPGTYNDLLDMLLSARYEDTGQPMDEDQVIDEVLVLLFAGHETTANTLSWTLGMIASQPAVLERLKENVEGTDANGSVRNEYINAVINESMRLRPAAWMTDRVALSDDRYGPYSYPKGTIILSFFYGLHRHKDHWEDADAFRPERFLDENGKMKKPAAYFPFGAGPRMCIGNNFAMAEMSIFLRAFIRKFSIDPTGQTPAMMPLMTLRPDKMILKIKRRGA